MAKKQRDRMGPKGKISGVPEASIQDCRVKNKNKTAVFNVKGNIYFSHSAHPLNFIYVHLEFKWFGTQEENIFRLVVQSSFI